jgi:hypothetical protein
LFLSTSKKQVPQQQDALLSALGYDTLRKKQNGYDDDDGAMKPSVWGTTNAVAAPMSKNTQRPLLKDDHPDHSHILSPLPLPSSSSSLSSSSEHIIHSVTKDNVPLPQQTETETTMTPTNDTTSPSNTTPNTTSTKTTSTDTNTTSSSNTSTTNMIHDQVEYMRQLEKSRMERKRLEEESRILEQKERAAARLMALERKLGGSTSTAVTACHQQDSSIHDGIGPSTTKEEPETSSSNDTSRFDRTRSTSPQPIM